MIDRNYSFIDDLTETSYKAIADKCVEVVIFDITKFYNRMLVAVPMNVNNVTSVMDLIEGVLERYGDVDGVIDHEALGIRPGAKERMMENLEATASIPKESIKRIIRDIVAVLKGIADRVIELMDSIHCPVVSEVGAIYRFHRLEKGQVMLHVLSYKELMTISGRPYDEPVAINKEPT